MQYRLIVLHAFGLAITNLGAIYLGKAWDVWTHLQHPFAAQIPLGTILAIVGFVVWYKALSFFSRKTVLQSRREWHWTYGLAFVLGALCFIAYHAIGQITGLSLGRLVTFFVFQSVVNFLAIMILYGAEAYGLRSVIQPLFQTEWFSRILAVGFGVFVGLLLVFLIEGTFYLLNKQRPTEPEKVLEGSYARGELHQRDSLMGSIPKSLAEASSRLTYDGEVIWDILYTTDQFSRRATPVPDSNQAEEFVLFFGCSYTFGLGVEDYETLPAVFGATVPHYRPYNYAFPGYGTQHMLTKLRKGISPSEVEEKRGILVYIYLEDIHETRVIGSMYVANKFGRRFPYYEMDSGGALHRKGTMTTGRPVLSFIYPLLGKSQLVRYYKLDFPKLGDRHYKITARMIEESKQLFESQFESTDFIVVMFPTKKNSAHRRLIPYLEKAGIKYLDYLDLFHQNPDEGYWFRGDGHPTPQALRMIAEQLAQDLQEF